MQVVDPHIHLWDAEKFHYRWLDTAAASFSGNVAELPRVYRIGEFLADTVDIEVLKVVHVEAFQDASSIPREAVWLQNMADDPKNLGKPEGIVVGINLNELGAVETLAAEAAHRNVRGIRQVLNRHVNPTYNYVDLDYMSAPVWRQNFQLLTKFGLSFDLQIYPSQVRQAVEVMQTNPQTQFILNHAGMFVDRDAVSGYRAWRDSLRLMAALDNVAVKISGLAMFDHCWTVESFRPYVLETIDAFGASRCMFASNFPIDRLHASYASLWHAYARIVGSATAAERQEMFIENAERIYRI